MKSYLYKNRLTSITLFVLISFSKLLLASDVDQLLDQVEQLIKSDKIDESYNLLNPIADDNAGNAEFDYLYGLLLQKMEQSNYSVLVLERALYMRPNHIPTQVALAKSYISLKEYSKAEKLQNQLQQEQATKEAATIKQLSQQQKDDEYKPSFKGFIQTSFSYDDNLTSGPDSNFLTIPSATHLGLVAIGDNLEKDQDLFYAVSGYLGIKVPVVEDFKIDMGIWGSQRFNRTRPDEDLAFMSSWIGGVINMVKII
ncbi:MAG: hypothetical protein Q9M50_12330 [Methylococcales bacterium]|nr:hypothetical protein [Methylococcales bacterium]